MNYLIDLTAILVVIYEIMLLIFIKLTLKDRLIIYLALFGQIFLYIKYFYDYKIIKIIPHILFWTVLILINLFSKNIYLLIIGFISLLLTFITRYLLDECLFYSIYEKKNNKGVTLKWTIINVILLIINLIKIIYYY